MDNFISLFDYLHKPAGNELGLKVYKKAVEENEPISFRTVTTAKYSGKVKLYRKSFLDLYFNNQLASQQEPSTTPSTPTDDLPF